MKISRGWCAIVACMVFTSSANAGNGRSLPPMTALTVQLDEAFNAKTAANGTAFVATLKDPVEVDGRTIIPAGASSGGIFNRQSQNNAQLELNSVFVNGRMYRITTEPVAVGQKTALRAGQTLTFHLVLSLNITR